MPTKRQLEMVKSLRIAKKRLERHGAWFICHALGYYGNSRLPHANVLREWIRKQLDGHTSYNFWVKKNYPKVYLKMNTIDFHNARIQWVDAMIEELLK